MPLKKQVKDSKAFSVSCVCGGFGFPFGTASTKRILLMGSCYVSAGIPFHVLHVGPSPFEDNKDKKGTFRELTFEYLSPSIRRPDNGIIRSFFYLWGCLSLYMRFIRRRNNIVVYIYYQGDFIDLWTLWLCRLMKICVVQEACEWWPGTVQSTYFKKWMYRNIMFRWSNGAIPISREIEDRIRNIARPDYPLCRIPVLVDPAENSTRLKNDINNDVSGPVFLWCGMVDGYKRDVLFLIDALAELKSSIGREARLRIVGPCSEKARSELLSYSNSKGISTNRIDMVGFVSDDQLWEYCTQADALLMPLWDDDRSSTRFPTKLGQYVAAGRPIITARIGEVKYFLTDETALFYPSGDAVGLARCLDQLLKNKSFGDEIAARARREVLPNFDFRSNAEKISTWVCKIYSEHRYV